MELGKIILEATKQANKVPEGQKVDVITGTVTKTKPLTIKISDKLIIDEANLILSSFVTETYIDLPTTPKNGIPAYIPGQPMESVGSDIEEKDVKESQGADNQFMHRHHVLGTTLPYPNEKFELTTIAQDARKQSQFVGWEHYHPIDFYTQFAQPKILLWRGLEEDDVVYMLRVGQGQTYFVLQRLEGVTNEKEGAMNDTSIGS